MGAGSRPGEIRQFDPGIFIDDDKRIYLFSGNSPRYKQTPVDKDSLKIAPSESWTSCSAPLSISEGKYALYFTYEGEGAADFRSFSFAS